MNKAEEIGKKWQFSEYTLWLFDFNYVNVLYIQERILIKTLMNLRVYKNSKISYNRN